MKLLLEKRASVDGVLCVCSRSNQDVSIKLQINRTTLKLLVTTSKVKFPFGDKDSTYSALVWVKSKNRVSLVHISKTNFDSFCY